MTHEEIKTLRECTDLSYLTDEQITECYKDTFLYEKVRFYIAYNNFKKQFIKSIINIFNR